MERGEENGIEQASSFYKVADRREVPRGTRSMPSSPVIPFMPSKWPRLGAVFRTGRLTRPAGELTLTMTVQTS